MLLARLPAEQLGDAPFNKPTQLAYVQDTVHVGTKLRSRLLTPSIILALRRYVAGAYHLQFVQNTYSKDQHGLRERDVD